MTIDFKALGAKAASEGADQTKSQAGGGTDITPAAEGPCLMRFIGYVELGKQKGTFKGAPTVKEKVRLIFELTGKRHQPVELPNGDKLPYRVTVEENYSLNEKASFFKIFQRMNYRQDAQHIVQLLGEGFKGEIHHRKWVGKDGKERIDVTLKGPGGYTIAPPRKEDEDSETGYVDVAVPPALSDIRCFLWEQADLNQWASLFIEGEYPERKDDKGNVTAPARSKNVFQNTIKNAVNFKGSPIYTLLAQNGQSLDIPQMDEQEEDEGNDNASSAAVGGALPQTGTAYAPAAVGSSGGNDKLGGIV
jgi:hypothetical protein